MESVFFQGTDCFKLEKFVGRILNLEEHVVMMYDWVAMAHGRDASFTSHTSSFVLHDESWGFHSYPTGSHQLSVTSSIRSLFEALSIV